MWMCQELFCCCFGAGSFRARTIVRPLNCLFNYSRHWKSFLGLVWFNWAVARWRKTRMSHDNRKILQWIISEDEKAKKLFCVSFLMLEDKIMHENYEKFRTNTITNVDNERQSFDICRRRSLLRSTHKAIVQVRPFTEGSVGFPKLRAGPHRRSLALSSRCGSNPVHCQPLSSRCVLRLRPQRPVD